MIRRISSASALRSKAFYPTTAGLAPSLTNNRMAFSDSLGDGNDNGNNSSSASIAGQVMCDTADGIYAAMLSSSAPSPATARPNVPGSVFGDSPAAVATSLIGVFFFATTYAYYIGGAVKEAAFSKFGGDDGNAETD